MILTLGDGIRMKREATKQSARHVSLEARLSPSYVGKVEKGEISPTIAAFYRICRAIGANDKEIVFLLRLAANADSS